jgi:hypothetical protein
LSSGYFAGINESMILPGVSGQDKRPDKRFFKALFPGFPQ